MSKSSRLLVGWVSRRRREALGILILGSTFLLGLALGYLAAQPGDPAPIIIEKY